MALHHFAAGKRQTPETSSAAAYSGVGASSSTLKKRGAKGGQSSMNQNTVLSGIYRSFFKMDESSETSSNPGESAYSRKQRKTSNESSPTEQSAASE